MEGNYFLLAWHGMALAVSAWFLIYCLVVRGYSDLQTRRGLPPLQRVEICTYLLPGAAAIFLSNLLNFFLTQETASYTVYLRPESLLLVRVLTALLLVYGMFRYTYRILEIEHEESAQATERTLGLLQRVFYNVLYVWLILLVFHLLRHLPDLGMHLEDLRHGYIYRSWEALIVLAAVRLPQCPRQIGHRFHAVLVLWLLSIVVQGEAPWVSVMIHAIAVLLLLLTVMGQHLRQRVELNELRAALTRERDLILEFLSTISVGADAGEKALMRGDRDRSVEAEDRFALDRVLKVTMEFAMEHLGAGGGCIFLLEEEQDPATREITKVLAPREVRGLYPPQTDISDRDYVAVKQKFLWDVVRNERIPLGDTIVGEVAQTGVSRLLVGDEARFAFKDHGIDYLRVHTAMVLPLLSGDTVEGVIALLQIGADAPKVKYSETDLRVTQSMVDQAAIAIKNANVLAALREKELLERDIRLAQGVQRLLLPEHCPTIPGFDFGALCRSAYRVGGDYYDFVRLDEDHMIIVVADVSGKGVPGALAMAMVRSMLVAHAPNCPTPKQLMVVLNRFVNRDLRSDMFVSMLLANVNLRTRTMDLCRAGHEPLVRISGQTGQADELTPSGLALGLDASDFFDTMLEVQQVALHEGDVFVFYTDGATEARNARGDEFTTERFIALAQEVHQQSAQAICDQIDQRITAFAGDVPQHDDLTLVVLRVLAEDDGDQEVVSAVQGDLASDSHDVSEPPAPV